MKSHILWEMVMRRVFFWGPILVIGAAASAQPRQPSEVGGLTTCRTIKASADRLACYDEAVAQLQQSISTRKIVILDRDEVRRTRRSLFGLTVSDIPFLGRDGDGDIEINTTIAAARPLQEGKWQLRLAEGGVWNMLETRGYAAPPRAGQSVRIRKAAMGSYLMNIANQRAIRVRRQN